MREGLFEGTAMRLIIEARIEGAADTCMPVSLGVIERSDNDLTPGTLGLSLQEGREILRRSQAAVVSAQKSSWLASRSICPVCGELSRKDSGTIVCRTVFGKVRLDSPRFRQCWCRTPSWYARGFTFSPLAATLRQRVTSELDQLQVQWAAQLPYRTAVRLLGQMLPLTDAISVSGTRNRVLAVGQHLDEQSERQIGDLPAARGAGAASASVSVVAVDSVWVSTATMAVCKADNSTSLLGAQPWPKAGQPCTAMSRAKFPLAQSASICSSRSKAFGQARGSLPSPTVHTNSIRPPRAAR